MRIGRRQIGWSGLGSVCIGCRRNLCRWHLLRDREQLLQWLLGGNDRLTEGLDDWHGVRAGLFRLRLLGGWERVDIFEVELRGGCSGGYGDERVAGTEIADAGSDGSLAGLIACGLRGGCSENDWLAVLRLALAHGVALWRASATLRVALQRGQENYGCSLHRVI